MKKLSTITTQYRKFNNNQVLTEGQLNEFLEYFEDQDHLSRISLSGVGIVCGFKVTYNASLKEVSIGRGYGVTTDGDLLTLVESPKQTIGEPVKKGLQLIENAFKTYTHYRVFEDNNVKYTPFFFKGKEQIELLEIFPKEDISPTDTSYTKLNTLSPALLDDKVVIIYLENYLKQGNLCTALDCDNQGLEQVEKLRVLLVSSDDAKTIAGYDPIYNEHNWNEKYLDLPEIGVKRDILTSNNTKNYIDIKQHYLKLFNDNQTLTDLGNGLDVILKKFKKPTISSHLFTFFNLNSSSIPFDFQYKYDALKDVVDTYIEIKELLLHINVHCCPSIGSFPKHLLLGRLKENQSHYKSYRHRFYKSPIIGHENENLQRVLHLLDRVLLLMNNYLEENKGEEIKITPSQIHEVLSKKAVPFYYDVSDKLLNYWSFNNYKNYAQKSNLSYHTENLSNALSVKEPLLYSIDKYDFLRIEGIQGKLYQDALDQVLQLKKEYGLSFDVKTLSINATTKSINLADYRCEFEDLNILLKAWTTEQECILASMASFFSGFSTETVGSNVTENDYTQQVSASDVQIDYATSDGSVTSGTSDTSNTSATSGFSNTVETEVARGIRASSEVEQQPMFFRNAQPSISAKRNVIDNSLTLQQNTLGLYMKKAFVENQNGSVSDIKNTVKADVGVLLSTDAWVAHPDIRDFVLHDAVDLLTTTFVLSEKIPQSISEIDTGTIDAYELTLNEVCLLVKRLKVTYQTIDLGDTLKDILGLLINQLSSVCCSGEKLTILLEEIEKRKTEIITQIQLSEFVKKHPGLRHQAGVIPGGTFVMAYLTENASDESTYHPIRVEFDFLQQPNIDDNGTDGDEGMIRLWDDRMSTKFAFLHKVTNGTQNPRNEVVMIGGSIAETVSNLVDFLNNIWRIAGYSNKCKASSDEKKLIIDITDQKIRKRENYILFFNPAIIGTNRKVFFNENATVMANNVKKNRVVADFSLPYMCCSDCAPINFIVPKEPVSLGLPVAHICLDETTESYPFKVSPADGEVKAIVEGNLSSGVIKNEEGAYFFDANLLDASLYGATISFTVNNEETDAVITVLQSPQPIVLPLSEDFIYNTARPEVEAFFKVSGTGISTSTEFAWDFGDNTSVDPQKPDLNGIVRHTYALSIESNNTVFPKVTVTNGLCLNNVILEGISFLDPVEVSLSIQETVCLDTSNERALRIPFSNISPSEGEIGFAETAGITGLSIDQDAKELVISPVDFNNFNNSIAFTVNNLSTTAQIIISKIMEITIEKDPEGFIWEGEVLKGNYFFNAQLPNDVVDIASITYEWSVDGVVVNTNKSFRHQFVIRDLEEGNSFDIEVRVSESERCTSMASISVNIPFPDFSLSLPEDIKYYCLKDETPYLITLNSSVVGTQIEGLGVRQNNDNTYVFIPNETGITSSQEISLRIVGTSEVLKVNLKSEPVANFTVEVTTKGRLLIVNTSDTGATSYVWNIGEEKEITRLNRTGFDFDINDFKENVINISLTVNGAFCSNTLVKKDIVIRQI